MLVVPSTTMPPTIPPVNGAGPVSASLLAALTGCNREIDRVACRRAERHEADLVGAVALHQLDEQRGGVARFLDLGPSGAGIERHAAGAIEHDHHVAAERIVLRVADVGQRARGRIERDVARRARAHHADDLAGRIEQSGAGAAARDVEIGDDGIEIARDDGLERGVRGRQPFHRAFGVMNAEDLLAGRGQVRPHHDRRNAEPGRGHDELKQGVVDGAEEAELHDPLHLVEASRIAAGPRAGTGRLVVEDDRGGSAVGRRSARTPGPRSARGRCRPAFR